MGGVLPTPAQNENEIPVIDLVTPEQSFVETSSVPLGANLISEIEDTISTIKVEAADQEAENLEFPSGASSYNPLCQFSPSHYLTNLGTTQSFPKDEVAVEAHTKPNVETSTKPSTKIKIESIPSGSEVVTISETCTNDEANSDDSSGSVNTKNKICKNFSKSATSREIGTQVSAGDLHFDKFLFSPENSLSHFLSDFDFGLIDCTTPATNADLAVQDNTNQEPQPGPSNRAHSQAQPGPSGGNIGENNSPKSQEIEQCNEYMQSVSTYLSILHEEMKNINNSNNDDEPTPDSPNDK